MDWKSLFISSLTIKCLQDAYLFTVAVNFEPLLGYGFATKAPVKMYAFCRRWIAKMEEFIFNVVLERFTNTYGTCPPK